MPSADGRVLAPPPALQESRVVSGGTQRTPVTAELGALAVADGLGQAQGAAGRGPRDSWAPRAALPHLVISLYFVCGECTRRHVWFRTW